MKLPENTSHSRKWLFSVNFLTIFLSAFLLCTSVALLPQSPPSAASDPVIAVANPPNTPAQQSKHYVILVSLDGFRYDYPAKYDAKNILDIAAHGASAPDGMIPAYPSLTFPNHYTMITGLYPEHTGIVANRFYDPARQATYSMSDQKAFLDGTWYGGVPLWSLAQQQGMRAASFFWPGSDAEIAGQRPSYYLHFDDKFPDAQRVDQVIAWLKLPPEQRPHFITLYYSNVDTAGHNFGPDTAQTGDAVRHVDDMMGLLMADLKTLNLPVDLIVIADHGMILGQGDWINLNSYADLSNFVTAGSLLYAKTDADAETAFTQLQGKSDKFQVFRRKDVPPRLHYDSNARIGDPVVIPTGPYYIRASAPPAGRREYKKEVGVHGYDPYTMKEMHALFVAEGPDIRPGVTVPSFDNVNLYPLIAKILGLQIGPIDGRLQVLKSILRK
ncbi:MAG: ectonucleotide pyrophosphatase/phosphodiesterase [Candidatus Acidiferrales bacterium]